MTGIFLAQVGISPMLRLAELLAPLRLPPSLFESKKSLAVEFSLLVRLLDAFFFFLTPLVPGLPLEPPLRPLPPLPRLKLLELLL